MDDLVFYSFLIALTYYLVVYLPKTKPSTRPVPLSTSRSVQTDPDLQVTEILKMVQTQKDNIIQELKRTENRQQTELRTLQAQITTLQKQLDQLTRTKKELEQAMKQKETSTKQEQTELEQNLNQLIKSIKELEQSLN